MSSKRVRFHPATSARVPFQFRIGYGGKSAECLGLKHLQPISKQTAILEVGMAWVDCFQLHFGVYVDPDLYCVEKQQLLIGKTKTRKPRVKHNLREQVKVFLAEFKYPQSVFTVYITKLSKLEEIIQRPPPQLSPAMTILKEKVRRRVKKTVVRKSNHHVTMNLAAVGKPATKTSSAGHSRSIPIQVSRHEDNNNNFRRNNFPVVISPQPQAKRPRPSTTVSGFQPYNNRPPYNKASKSVHNRNEDDDALSSISNDSQDSQLADLLDLGVKHEDIKGPFCKKVQRYYSNAQLLKMKHEMTEFKKNNYSAWTKWVTSTPHTANIIRELFQI